MAKHWWQRSRKDAEPTNHSNHGGAEIVSAPLSANTNPDIPLRSFTHRSSKFFPPNTKLTTVSETDGITPAHHPDAPHHRSSSAIEDEQAQSKTYYDSAELHYSQKDFEVACKQYKIAYNKLSNAYTIEISFNPSHNNVAEGRRVSVTSESFGTFTSSAFTSSEMEFLRSDTSPPPIAITTPTATPTTIPEASPDILQSITDPNILYQLGIKLSRAKKYDEAIKYYKTAISLGGPNSEHYNAIAFNYYLLQDPTEAKIWCKKILEFTPAYGPAHATLAYIYKDEAVQARELGMEANARMLFKKAISELRTSKTYEKKIIKSEESYKSNIELGAMILEESGDVAKANEYFNRAEGFLAKKLDNKPTHITQKKVDKYAQYTNDLAYIEELKACCTAAKVKATISPSFASSYSAHSNTSNVDLSLVKKAADGFRLGVSISALKAEMKAEKAEMQAEMAAIKETMVHRDEVSVAIANNPHQMHVLQQSDDIDKDPKLKEYYAAFRSVLSETYTSAETIKGGQVALDTGGLLQQGFNMALSCIPLIGGALATIAEVGEEWYQSANIRKHAILFLRMAATPGDLEAIITQVASDVTLHPHKREAILSSHEAPKITGFLNKLISKCKSIKASVDKTLDGGELYKTDYAKLGVEDAMHVIEQFVKYAATLKTTFADKNEAIKILKHALIPAEHWVLTQTDTSTVVHTHVVEHFPTGEIVVDKTHTSSTHRTSYKEDDPYVEVPVEATPHTATSFVPLNGNSVFVFEV